MRLNRRTAILGALTSALVILAGCAQSSESSTASNAGLNLVDDGKLTFAMSGEYRPFNFYDKSGQLAGFDVDIGKEISKRLDLQPNPVTGPFDSLIAGLTSKRFDLVIGSMSPTEERKKAVDFTSNYYESGAQLFVQQGSSIKSTDDLKDATVGVVLGTTFEALAKQIDGISDIRTYKSDNQALTELSNGRLDAVITTKLLGLYQIKETGIKVEPAGDVLAPDPAAIASRKDNKELTAKVDELLKEIKDDGTYAEISQKWFGQDISKSS